MFDFDVKGVEGVCGMEDDDVDDGVAGDLYVLLMEYLTEASTPPGDEGC